MFSSSFMYKTNKKEKQCVFDISIHETPTYYIDFWHSPNNYSRIISNLSSQECDSENVSNFVTRRKNVNSMITIMASKILH